MARVDRQHFQYPGMYEERGEREGLEEHHQHHHHHHHAEYHSTAKEVSFLIVESKFNLFVS